MCYVFKQHVRSFRQAGNIAYFRYVTIDTLLLPIHVSILTPQSFSDGSGNIF